MAILRGDPGKTWRERGEKVVPLSTRLADTIRGNKNKEYLYSFRMEDRRKVNSHFK